jgi:hypothetical protein
MSIHGNELSSLEAEMGYFDMMLFEEIRMAIQNGMADIYFWKKVGQLLDM